MNNLLLLIGCLNLFTACVPEPKENVPEHTAWVEDENCDSCKAFIFKGKRS